MDIVDDTRLEVGRQQPAEFFDQAVIDLDGTLVPTTGECKEGRNISYKGTWGYPPLIVSLAGTGEVLRIVNRKKAIVKERKFKNLRTNGEQVAEFTYQPAACRKPYRLIVLRKDLTVENDPQGTLFDDYRYFLYITNDGDTPAEQIVFSANGRCNQENLIEQGKNGPRYLRAPLDNLLSNWAYMVRTALAWNLKAWGALMLPEHPRWREKHRREKQRVLRMEFKLFLNSFIQVPCQLV